MQIFINITLERTNKDQLRFFDLFKISQDFQCVNSDSRENISSFSIREESLLISAALNLSDFLSRERLRSTEKIIANSKWENDGMGVMECRKSVSLSLSKLRAYRQYVFISLRSSSLEFSSRS